MIVTICGSTKFMDGMKKLQEDLTFKGYTVFIPVEISKDKNNLDEDEKNNLFYSHMEKVTFSDYVIIYDKDGYIGEGTESEIKTIREIGKNIKYYFDTREDEKNNNKEILTIRELRNSGIIFYINQVIHVFGLALQVMKLNKNRDFIGLRVVRTRFRGFGAKSIDEGYEKVTKYISENMEYIMSAFDEENK